jgi:hypothetical protein
MKKSTLEKIIGIGMLLFAIGFNLWLYRLEPTATIDPNDNSFQFALVDRTNTIWDFAIKKCSSSAIGIATFPLCHFTYLADHWVNNWAEGYNLPYYYSHIPQIMIVASYRMSHLPITLFQYYHIIIYLLLCFIPASIYYALYTCGLSPLTAGIGALLATNFSTDGLYGLDPSSFLWRGYGLSSQLFAMVWLPLALAFSYRYFSDTKKYLLPAIFFVTATTAGHLGIGIITMLSLGFLAVSKPIMMFLRQEPLKATSEAGKEQFIRLSLVAGISIFLLSYWILPTFIDGNYHNISFWDPVWKFDSYGWKDTMIRLFNGDLFDFGRLPYITILTLIGVFAGLASGISGFVSGISDKYNNDSKTQIQYTKPNIRDLYPFSFLFIFWLLFYFGRTTWGGMIDLIPGMKDFHLSRFIVGLHVAGMLLAPIGFSYLVSRISNLVYGFLDRKSKSNIPNTNTHIPIAITFLTMAMLLPPIYKWTTTYNQLNDKLIVQANNNYAKVKPDEQKLFAKLRSLTPARIFAGRGGGYGKRFTVAETPYFMDLSTYGLPTTLWLPETWSMNSDTEQYFSENVARDYDLYNIRWVAAPPDEKPQEFWKQVDEAPTWKLYEVPTTGYFTTGIRPAIVSVGKQSFMTVVHLWIQSDYHQLGLYPQLTFDTDYPKTSGLPNFKMLDEVTFKTPDNKIHNVWSEPPVYLPTGFQSKEELVKAKRESYADIKLNGPETNDHDMIFKTSVTVGANCKECMVILKHTYHPNWKTWVDGKRVTPITVFPFYIGIPVSAGTHTIVAAYEPSNLKVTLLVFTLCSIAGGIYYSIKLKKRS